MGPVLSCVLEKGGGGGGGLVSAILPMHNKWIIGFCTQTIGPSVFLFTLASLRLPLVPRQQSRSAAYLPLN